ncbi:MAG: hypothetical protein IJB71_04645 [Bacilli bacterium]|nr:hypothetical protein [Bacilli bacterium]
MLVIPSVNKAAAGIVATIGNNYYEGLEQAIAAASSNDVIKLVADANLSESQLINKTVNINLNGHNITADESVFTVQGGSLNLTGSGTIKELNPNYGAIVMKGSEDATERNYSTVSVGKDITLEGWSGIFVAQTNGKAYGVNVNMNGTINAVRDTNDNVGAGIYINGKIQHKDNHPVINLTDTTKITSTGDGLYVAGYATININGASITGTDSGLALKSGIFNINSGTISCTGPDKTPTSGNTNGINPSGSAIQIESNSNYAGDIELNIKGGLIKSSNSYAIYEYTPNSATTKVSNIAISGGEFISGASKPVFSFSDSFKSKHTAFISGGEFSTSPADYLKSGYTTEEKSDMYEVIKTTSKEISGINRNNTTEGNSSFFWVIVILLSLSLGFGVYIFRNKIKTIFK